MEFWRDKFTKKEETKIKFARSNGKEIKGKRNTGGKWNKKKEFHKLSKGGLTEYKLKEGRKEREEGPEEGKKEGRSKGREGGKRRRQRRQKIYSGSKG